MRYLMAASPSFYKRVLPKALTAFSSSEGRLLFRRALEQGNMESYFDLAAQYVTQARPEDCARSTLVMTLNALNLDPGKVWMKPWRWYTEAVLNCLDAKPGMSLHEFARTAMCNGTYVQAYYPSSQQRFNPSILSSTCDTHHHSVRVKYASEHTFRTALLSSVRRTGLIMVVNHSRKALEQTGDGHYSPVAGFDEVSDKALVLDVARFKYPPFWVPIPKLYSSLEWIDPETQKMRGFLLLSRSPEYPTACRFSIDSTSLHRVDRTYEEMMKSPQSDFLPLLYFCYFSISDLLEDSQTAIVSEIESLPAFAKVKTMELDPRVRQLISEIAEDRSDHFLAVMETAMSGEKRSLSPQLLNCVGKVRAELGGNAEGWRQK